MTAARVRLIVAAVLFCSWLGWLAYLALTASGPIVLSRPQFLVADAWIVADLKGDARPNQDVTVAEVIWSSGDAPKVGQTIRLVALKSCGKEQHWSGPGRYILPLTSTGIGYKLTPVPQSPGFAQRDWYLIYPERKTRDQAEQLKKARIDADRNA